MSYLLADGKAPQGALKGEACVAFNPDRLSIDKAEGGYALKSGKETVRAFADKAEAEAALAAIRKYGFTNLCTIGKDKVGLEYMRR